MYIETDATVPRLRRIVEELMRYHNVAYACMFPNGPMVAGNTQAQAVLLQLKQSQEDEPGQRSNPPHIVAGIRLDELIRQDVALVLDAMPEMARLWQQPFDELFETISEIAGEYTSGRDRYDKSLGKAFWLARRAARLAQRVDAKADAQEGEAKSLMTDGQKAVWDALRGSCKSAKELASDVNTSDVTVRQHIFDLRKADRKILHRPGRGYWRPDAPAPE